jgi:superoxide dismutase, Cu-Zn family
MGALPVTATVLLAAFAVPAAAPDGAVGVFEPYRPGAQAITYDQAKVPVGSSAMVIHFSTGRSTVVALFVHGLVPHRHYGAHVHVNQCGPLPADSGPHFQNVPDPVQPSVDPAYANPHNEVWLDFTTDAWGSALAISTVSWTFQGRPAGSVVIHDHHTQIGGDAGARLACLTENF